MYNFAEKRCRQTLLLICLHTILYMLCIIEMSYIQILNFIYHYGPITRICINHCQHEPSQAVDSLGTNFELMSLNSYKVLLLAYPLLSNISNTSHGIILKHYLKRKVTHTITTIFLKYFIIYCNDDEKNPIFLDINIYYIKVLVCININ